MQRFTLPGILLGTTQLVGQALVTVACFFLSHDASDSKHKNKDSSGGPPCLRKHKHSKKKTLRDAARELRETFDVLHPEDATRTMNTLFKAPEGNWKSPARPAQRRCQEMRGVCQDSSESQCLEDSLTVECEAQVEVSIC